MAKVRASAAARLVGCSYWTIRSWVEQGLISVEPLGESGHFLYDEEELLAMKEVFRKHGKRQKLGREPDQNEAARLKAKIETLMQRLGELK